MSPLVSPLITHALGDSLSGTVCSQHLHLSLDLGACTDATCTGSALAPTCLTGLAGQHSTT